jgi:hypothetical protein
VESPKDTSIKMKTLSPSTTSLEISAKLPPGRRAPPVSPLEEAGWLGVREEELRKYNG